MRESIHNDIGRRRQWHKRYTRRGTSPEQSELDR